MKRSLLFGGFLTCLLLLLLQPGPAPAQGQLLSYSLKPAVQKGSGYPQVYLHAETSFRKVDLVCTRSDGEEISLSAGSTRKGQKRSFDLKQPPGTFDYECEARGWYGKDSDEYFDLALRFQTFLGGPLKIEVPHEQIDLKNRTITIRGDREITGAHLTITGPDGPFFDQDVDVVPADPGEDIWLDWTGGGSDVLRLDITLTDEWGFFSYENIFPWSLEIDHEDIHFETGSHEITPGEQPKVDRAWKDIDKTARRYGRFVEVRLYIAGYTDTVGDRSSNQGLSERRARAIAQAFRDKGFSGPLYYQGFGESALEVATDDGVDEILNRRAVYLLASRPPQPSSNFPRSQWKKL
ncbi:MAG: OmpA family protein [Myxococcota bacterium]|nr:OmpA family protein [Myxococcota bacterium]